MHRAAEPPVVALPRSLRPPGRIAFVGPMGGPTSIRVTRADRRGGIREIVPRQGLVPAISWAPDGRRLAYVAASPGEGERVEIFSVSRRVSDVLLRGAPLGRGATRLWYQLAWSPSGTELALLRGDPANSAKARVDIVGLDGKNERSGLAPDVNEVSRLGWSRDSRRLVYRVRVGRRDLGPFGQLGILDVRSGSRRRLRLGQPATDPTWSPSGRLIAAATSKGIAVFTPSGRGLRVLTHGGARDHAPTWSPDGRWIAFSHQRGSCQAHAVCEKYLYVVRATGGATYYIRRPKGLFFVEIPIWGR